MSLRDYLLQHRESVPEWLSRFTETQEFDSSTFFQSRVVFYPNAGFDGSAVKVFGGAHAAHCFIYVDYGRTNSEVARELENHGFAGYTNLIRRELAVEQIAPAQWQPHLGKDDLQAGNYPARSITPFGFLQILERQGHLDDDHGAHRLAILFLGADGIATYDALFSQAGQQPPFAAILQDHGFGGQYTSFGAGGLLETVASRSDRFPGLLLVGVGTPAWDGYKQVLDVDGASGGEWAQHMRFLFMRGEEIEATAIRHPLTAGQVDAGSGGAYLPQAEHQQLAQIAWNEANREVYLDNNNSFVERYAYGGLNGLTLSRLYQHVAPECRVSVLTEARLVIKRLSQLMPNAVHASKGIEGDTYSIWVCLGMIAPNVAAGDGRLNGMIDGTTRIGLTCIGGQIFLVLRLMTEGDARPDLLQKDTIQVEIRDAAFAYISAHLRSEGQYRQHRRIHLPLNPINGGFSIPGQPLSSGSPLSNFLVAVDCMYRDHVFSYRGNAVAASDLRQRYLEERLHIDGHPGDVICPRYFD